MAHHKILIATSTYNEADSIGILLTEIRAYHPQATILVIDDNSPDGTSGIVAAMRKSDEGLVLITRPRKLGVGSAHKLAIKYATRNKFDFLVTMDADLSHSPKDIETIIALLRCNDFVIGSRFAVGGTCDYGLLRGSLSRLANILTRILIGITLKETTTSFRGFSKELLQKLPLDKITSSDYGFFVHLTYLVLQHTDKVIEFPIRFLDRRYGQSKISKKEIFKAADVLCRLFIARVLSQPKSKQSEPDEHKDGDCCVICESAYYQIIFPAKGEDHDQRVSSANLSCNTTSHHSHGRIVRCLECGLTYTNPLPDNQKLLEGYKYVVDKTYLRNLAGRTATFSRNLESVIRFLHPRGRLLDVGCFVGEFLQVAKAKGFMVHGVDPSEWAVNYAREHLDAPIWAGTLKDVPSEVEPFDVITSFDVLEHLPNPLQDCTEINRRLVSGGMFIFSTLNIDSWFPRIMGERWPWYMDMHLIYFNRDSLSDLLHRTGFRIVDISCYHHIVRLEYLVNKIASLTRLPTLSKFVPTGIADIRVPIGLGDIELYTCIKVAEPQDISRQGP